MQFTCVTIVGDRVKAKIESSDGGEVRVFELRSYKGGKLLAATADLCNLVPCEVVIVQSTVRLGTESSSEHLGVIAGDCLLLGTGWRELARRHNAVAQELMCADHGSDLWGGSEPPGRSRRSPSAEDYSLAIDRLRNDVYPDDSNRRLDERTVVDFCLWANADDAEPVDAAWLREVGFTDSGRGWWAKYGPFGAAVELHVSERAARLRGEVGDSVYVRFPDDRSQVYGLLLVMGCE